jgi:drug/metabolite transporter (DMT)-like permease
MQMTFVTFLTCGLAGGIAALVWEDMAVTVGPAFIWPLAYLTVFATVVSLGIQNRFQGDTTPTRAAVIFSLEPVIAAVFAYIFRAERLGMTGMVGAATIFCGLILSELSESIPLLRNPVLGRRSQVDSSPG